MDNMEEALQETSNYLNAKKEKKENTTTYQKRLSTPTIEEIQEIMRKPGWKTKDESYEDREKKRMLEYTKREYELWKQTREAKRNNFRSYIQTCGVPKIFQNKKHKIEHYEKSLFITGTHGTGKTYMAVGILENFVKNLHCAHFVEPFRDTPLFVTVPKLLLQIRSCFNSNESEEKTIKRYIETPVLVLDDLGAEKTTEWALQSLYVIINDRYSEEKQTIITSNLSLNEIKEKVGDRIASRISGMCDVVELTGKDRRLKNGQI